MKDKEKSILLSRFEKIKSYPCNLFNNKDWEEFDSFYKQHCSC